MKPLHENIASTIHFRLEGETLHIDPKLYDHIKSEIIIDNYFQMEPICSIAHGDWPKTRVTISNDKKSTNSFIYKGKVKDNHEEYSVIVEEFDSNYDLIQHILHIKNYEPSNQGISQEFFTTTTILCHVFRHKQDDVELHICVLKLDQEMFYNFGKISKTCETGDNKYILLDRFKELNLIDAMFVVPTNPPVIQKMLHERNPLLESMNSNELYLIDKYASSMSGTVISPSIENTELLKLVHMFKYMAYE